MKILPQPDGYEGYVVLVEPGDTLVFSALGYKMQTMLVSDFYSLDKAERNIILEQDTIQLRELIITPWQ